MSIFILFYFFNQNKIIIYNKNYQNYKKLNFPMRKCLNTHGVSSNPGLWEKIFKGTCELMVFVENALLIFYIELRKRFPPQNIQ